MSARKSPANSSPLKMSQPKLTSFFKPVLVDLTDENSPKVCEMPSPPQGEVNAAVNRSTVSDESTPSSDLGKSMSKLSSSSGGGHNGGVMNMGVNGGSTSSSSRHTKVSLDGEESSGEKKPPVVRPRNSSGSSSSSNSSSRATKKLVFLNPVDMKSLYKSFLKREDRVQIIVEPEALGAAPRNFRDYVRYTDAISEAGLHCPDDVCFICKLGSTEGPLLSCHHRAESGPEEKPCTKKYHRGCVQDMYDWKRGDFCSLGKMAKGGRGNAGLKRQRSVLGTSAWECPRHFCFGCMDSDKARYTCSYCPMTLCSHCGGDSHKIDAVFGEHSSSDYPDVEEARDRYAYRLVPVDVANTTQTWGLSKLDPRAELVVCPHCVSRFDQCLALKLMKEGALKMNATDGSFDGFLPSTDSHPVFGKNDEVLVGSTRPPPPSPKTSPSRARALSAPAAPGVASADVVSASPSRRTGSSLSPRGRGGKSELGQTSKAKRQSNSSASLSPVGTPGQSSSSSSRKAGWGSASRSSQEEMPPPTVTARTPARESRLGGGKAGTIAAEDDPQEMSTASESEQERAAANRTTRTRRGRPARTARKSDGAADDEAGAGRDSESDMEVDKRSSGDESWSDVSDASGRRRSRRLGGGSDTRGEGAGFKSAGASKRVRSVRADAGSRSSSDASLPASHGLRRVRVAAGGRRDSGASSTDDDDDDGTTASNAVVSVRGGSSLQPKRRGRPPAKRQRKAHSGGGADAEDEKEEEEKDGSSGNSSGIASSRPKREAKQSSAEQWLSSIEQAQRAQHPSKCGFEAVGAPAENGGGGDSAGAGGASKKSVSNTVAKSAAASLTAASAKHRGKGTSPKGREWATLEDQVGPPHLRDVVMRDLPGRLFSNKIVEEDENNEDEEEEGRERDEEGEDAEGSVRSNTKRRKAVVAIGKDTTFSGLLDSVYGFTDEAHPHEVRRASMKKLSKAAMQRKAKSEPAPGDVPVLAVAAVRAGLREDDDALLMDLCGVWDHKKGKGKGKGKVEAEAEAAPAAVEGGIPTLEFEELHRQLDATDPLVLLEQRSLLSSQALLLPAPRAKQSLGPGPFLQIHLAGRHNQQSLARRFNLQGSLLLRKALEYKLGWSSSLLVDSAVFAMRWKAGEGVSGTEAEGRLPAPRDVDTLLFEATRLRDSALQHAHCCRLRAIEQAALRPLPSSILPPAAPAPAVAYDAFWEWRPSFVKFLSLLEAVGSMLDAQTAEEQWDGHTMEWRACHLDKEEVGGGETTYRSAESATQALVGAVECLRFHAVFMARARVQWGASEDSKAAAKRKSTKEAKTEEGDDDDDDDDDDDLLMAAGKASHGNGNSNGSDSTTTIALGPLLPSLLGEANLTAEQAFFSLLVEACRLYRWYLVVAGKPVSVGERAGRGQLATLARTALCSAGHVLRHLYHLAHPAEVEDAQGKALEAVLVRSLSANINNLHLMGVAMFITIGLEHDCCPDMPTATTPVAAVFLRRLAAMQLGAHEYSGGDVPGNTALAKEGDREDAEKRDREDRAEEASSVRQALNAELFARRSLHHLD